MSTTYTRNGWNVTRVNGFDLFELVLEKDKIAAVPVDVPAQATLGSSDVGINTYRFNAFIEGAFKVGSTVTPEFIRSRGDGGDESRVTIKGSFHLLGMEERNRFMCINAQDPMAKLYLSKNYALAPGESCVITPREMEQNVFIVEGALQVNDGGVFNSIKHLRLTKPQDYSFRNTGQDNAFLVYVYEATVEEVKAQCTNVPVESLATVESLQE